MKSSYSQTLKVFEDVVHKALDMVAPEKKVYINPKYVPYMNDEIKDLIKERDDARKKAILTESYEDWQYFRELRRQVTSK